MSVATASASKQAADDQHVELMRAITRAEASPITREGTQGDA
jgi:hypothetical protein